MRWLDCEKYKGEEEPSKRQKASLWRDKRNFIVFMLASVCLDRATDVVLPLNFLFLSPSLTSTVLFSSSLALSAFLCGLPNSCSF